MGRQGLSVQFFDSNIPAGIQQDISLCLFRVLEEAITNVARHSGAQSAVVTLDFDHNIVLRVSDKGRGFAGDGHAKKGLGVVSMRERVEALGGTLTITSRPGDGTTIEARVPAPGLAAEHRQSAETA
jgi:signal transduction histidine kinase